MEGKDPTGVRLTATDMMERAIAVTIRPAPPDDEKALSLAGMAIAALDENPKDGDEVTFEAGGKVYVVTVRVNETRHAGEWDYNIERLME